MRKISVLPSVITLGNLTSGFASIIYAADGEFGKAGWMILLGMIFDALDGQVARLTRTAGTFGIQLDSLCDVITFGLAPAVLINRLCVSSGWPAAPEAWLFSALYVACAALRLARFNVGTGVEEEDHESFHGLPSPAAAGQIATLVILNDHLSAQPILSLPSRPIVAVLPVVGLVMGGLMVSRVPYIHMGDRLFKGQRPFAHLVVLIFLCICMALNIIWSMAGVFTAYTVVGIIYGIRQKLAKPPERLAGLLDDEE